MQSVNSKSLGMKSSFCPVTNEPSPNATRSFGSAFHISYNPRSAGYGSDTTAIVLQDRVFFVLKGDHAGALCKVAAEEGAKGCADYFAQNIDRASDLSEHLMATGLSNDPFALGPTALEVLGQEGVDRIATAAKAQMDSRAAAQ
ncbi:hypothetical protein EGJ28_16330 [Stutzerimonas xanthomarina]|jgi:hypothetical protein|uniref:Uncharacterized protein n=1 Tax=Stutzerimonas xanthomarina TaxID=271420 RepID=A0A3R8W789_9GAMM|nr:hypothetical protein [Stutzerimonas xanthomarina]RRV08832.1 hypothetical protein EGJ28_16330 [Stutzerimonas xanthomarina]